MTPHEPSSLPGDALPSPLPGPLVLRMVALAVLVTMLVATASAWLVGRASSQEAIQRLMVRQADEVEVVARLLAGKLEQSQKVLRTVAEGLTSPMIQAPAPPDWILLQGMPAVRFFDAVQIAGRDGELRMNFRAGKLEKAADLDPMERDTLRRTLVDGKPLVSELIAPRTADARIMLTMPLHEDNGAVLGVVAGVLRLQSQGLLPPALTVPSNEDSRLVVFTRDGTILAHSVAARVMGHVQDEPGLAPVFAHWRQESQPVTGRGSTHVQPDYLVSMAGMPLPQWMVARVSVAQPLLAPLRGAQQEAWWAAAGTIALGIALVTVGLVRLAQPLTTLRQAASQLLRVRASSATPTWPRTSGEIATVVSAFEHLLHQQRQQIVREDELGEQLRAILDHASVGIAISRGGQLDVVGRQLCQMLGYHPRELRGRPARMLYASDQDYRRIGQRVRQEFAAHGAFDGDVCFARKDGSPVWARVQGKALQPGDAGAGTVWIIEDITAVREARALKAWEITHDPLTQLYHRTAFEQRLGVLLAQRSSRPGTDPGDDSSAGDGVLLYLDLDHFTVVNDVAGHDAGDDVLQHVARLLESHVRHMGWAARLGGDEFAVVLPGCTLPRGLAVAEQLRAAIASWEPSYDGRSFTLGASFGLVMLDASLQDVAAVLHAADMACYDAKRAGRNRVETRQAHEVGNSGRVPLTS